LKSRLETMIGGATAEGGRPLVGTVCMFLLLEAGIGRENIRRKKIPDKGMPDRKKGRRVAAPPIGLQVVRQP
jgi:hypothetical protein